LNKIEFEILRCVVEKNNQDLYPYLENKLGHTKNFFESALKELQFKKYITENGCITKEGMLLLEPYKVKNAIILAAGMSTRFAPVSYEIPKGLLTVKGEIMIERLIEQLQEAGIQEIVLVVGYMMEKFLYLRNKYNVKLVVNNEYSSKNTHSSIYVARDFLSNTYICCADNYYPENMFHKYEYHAYYCATYLNGQSHVERGLIFNEDGLIIDTNKPANNQWIMYGHAYYDNNFANQFKPILEKYYDVPGTENMYWETIYAENVEKVSMWVQKCNQNEIYEFDSMSELKQFDPEYISSNRIQIFDNICSVLECEIHEIKDIEPIKGGLNNKSFKFLCRNNYYVYRHPGENASSVINRKNEAISLNAAKNLGVDETLIYVDEENGWKISNYINIKEKFDFSNSNHIQMLANHLKVLHESKTIVEHSFDYVDEANKLINYIKRIDTFSYEKMKSVRESINPIIEYLNSDKWQISLCHNDIYEPNLLLEENKLHLIDWEFAGNSDIGYDICKLFSLNTSSNETIDSWLYYYYGRNVTKKEKIHLVACASIIYYYWFIWAVYVSKKGEAVSEYQMEWYDKMNYYRDMFLELLNEVNEWK